MVATADSSSIVSVGNAFHDYFFGLTSQTIVVGRHESPTDPQFQVRLSLFSNLNPVTTYFQINNLSPTLLPIPPLTLQVPKGEYYLQPSPHFLMIELRKLEEIDFQI